MLNIHNPIGFTVSNAIKQRIAELLHEYQVYLIEDDVYAELNYDDQKPLPMSYFDQHQRVLPAGCGVDYYPRGYFLWIALLETIDSFVIYTELLSFNIGIAPSLLFMPKNNQ